MQPPSRGTTAGAGADKAPFSYGRRRSVWESPQMMADATHAVSLSGTSPHVPPPRRRRRSVLGAGRPLDMGSAVHARACRTTGAEHVFLRQSLSLSSRSMSPPPTAAAAQPAPLPPAPLLVDPVAGCLGRLRYARSARAWDAIAGNCVAEAKQLGEADNDVLAWAASFILGRDPRQGLLLLESYVIATCAVLHEQQQGLLSRGSACVQRHNELLLDWLRHRSQEGTMTTARLPHCDVDPLRVAEATVRQTVLQAMQLMDAVELRRWYVTALVLCTSEGGVAMGSSGGAGGHKSGRAPTSQSGSSGAADGVAELDRTPRSSEPGSPTSRLAYEDGSAAGGRDAVSASDGYQAPYNLWFRAFFALCETPSDSASPPPMTSSGGFDRSDDESSSHAGGEGWSTGGAVAGGQPGKLARTLSWFKDRRGNGHSAGGGGGGSGSQYGSPLRGSRGRNSSFSAAALVARVEPRWSVAALRPLDQEGTAALLLAQCEEWDVFFITAVTALLTEHYRTCMMAASRFLHWAEEQGVLNSSPESSRQLHGLAAAPAGGGPSAAEAAGTTTVGRRTSLPSFTGVPGLQEYQCRLAILLRACASLQLGERLQLGKDIVALLSYPDHTLSYHVGCAIALYGLPLPAAKETVMQAAATVTNTAALRPGPSSARASPRPPLPLTVQRYLYAVTESVHALTLLQLGMVEAALTVATAALDRLEALLREHKHRCHIGEADNAVLFGALRNIAVAAATGLEDARAVLQVPLSAHHLVYIAVSPAFFGGLCAGGIRVKAQSDTHRLLYPSNLPLYASTRQVIPFHMNRAVYLFHAGQLRGAWDDACCAVAAADEVVGSVELAFTDCFPLRVYYFASIVGFALLDLLLFDDLEAAKACLSSPSDQAALDKKGATLRENETLSKEVVHICVDVVRRMRHFYPHSRLTELCEVQLAIMCGEKTFLSQAVLLADRYPRCPAAQNLLTLALHFDHHVPEAVDNAVKNLQAFPHCREVVRVHRLLQQRDVVYRFNYRGVLPTRYTPGSTSGGVSKRMVLLMVLLLANFALVILTVYANTPTITRYPDSIQNLVVRIQVPSLVPLFFAAVFVIHAVVAAVTSKNLISTTLTDLFFVDTRLNRALFCLRCIPLVNVVNALLISFAGNNFLFESGAATFVLYLVLSILFVPFTTRVWLLRSVDEPDVFVMAWLAILAVDTVTAFFVVIPHIILALLEPYMLVVFYFYAPTPRPRSGVGELPPSSSIRRRLLLHAHFSKSMQSRFAVGSGSRFLHIRCLHWLYYRTHCPMDTRYLAESQLEAEVYRVFPLIEGDEARALFANVPLSPMCAALTSVEAMAPVKASGGETCSANSDDLSTSGNGGEGRARLRPVQSRASAPVPKRAATHPRNAHHPPAGRRQLSPHSDGDEDGEDDEDGGDCSEGSPGPDVRAVDALRKQLSRTTRQQHPSLQKMASFVRFTTRTSLDDDSDEDEEEWDAADFDDRRGAAALHRTADIGDFQQQSPGSSSASSSSSSSSSLDSVPDARSGDWSETSLPRAVSRSESRAQPRSAPRRRSSADTDAPLYGEDAYAVGAMTPPAAATHYRYSHDFALQLSDSQEAWEGRRSS